MSGPTRYWIVDGTGKKVRVPSVTTILKQIGWSSSGLIAWAWKVGYDGQQLDDARRGAADVGTVVHAMIEAKIRGQALPNIDAFAERMKEEIRTSYQAFLDWCARYRFEATATELSLVSDTMRYGGTLDLALVDGQRCILDYKTSNAVYADHLCQLAAYGALWNQHNEKAPIERYHLLRLSKLDGSFHHHSWPSRALEPAFEAFKAARKLYDLEKQLKGKS